MIAIRLAVQRVTNLTLLADGQHRGEFEQGLLVFVGIGSGGTGTEATLGESLTIDNPSSIRTIEKAATKIVNMRIFPNSEKGAGEASQPMHASVLDIGGGIALVSQFTLWADLSKGNRPGFGRALEPQLARTLYLRFVDEVFRNSGRAVKVLTGIFGSDMQISATQDGPITLICDVRDGKIVDL